MTTHLTCENSPSRRSDAMPSKREDYQHVDAGNDLMSIWYRNFLCSA